MEPGGPASKPQQEMEEILQGLQERAKELFCLYRVGDLLRAADLPWEKRLQQAIEAIPQGWRYPEVCEARLEIGAREFRTPGFRETPWTLEAKVELRDGTLGRLQVAYTQERPPRDEGPFMVEERRLLEAIARQIALQWDHDEAAHAWEAWSSALQETGGEAGRKWRVIVDFLRRADPKLLERISRRLLNHLRWKGVEGLEAAAGSSDLPWSPEDDGNANRPIRWERGEAKPVPTDLVFRAAAEHLTEDEIVSFVHTWITRDKVSFLINTLEWQESSLEDIGEALARFHAMELSERDLPPSLLQVLKTSLLRRFFTDDVDYINIGKHLVTLEDFYHLSQHLVAPPNSHGRLGGKSAGIFLAQKIVERMQGDEALLQGIRVPKTWYMASDGIIAFMRHNGLEDIYDRKYMDLEEVRQQYPYVIQAFKSSSFPPELLHGLARILEDLGDQPLIVRSSSLLEDRTGASFSGKYKSLFLANQGSKEERLEALKDAVAEVYASVFGPDPIEYRAERNLLDVHEEMGILIQEVVGTRVGKYFLPAFAGVAFSNNEFRWSPRIRREDGLVRLVLGLGTRAVDRVGDDFPILLAPGQPGLRVNTTLEEHLRYSPRAVDLINLETGAFETVPMADFLRECANDLPLASKILSVVEEDRVRSPRGLLEDLSQVSTVVTFEGLVRDTPFLGQVGALLKVLRETLGMPVDVEFASDGRNLFLLQCRSQSFTEGGAPSPIPRGLPKSQVLFTAHRFISNGKVPDLTHAVYVVPRAYTELPELGQLKAVGQAVGRLNKLLPKRRFVLMGPGRWGSRGDIRLGVSVGYSDINNTALLVEIAHRSGGAVPDLSFGTHFFQDLVEAHIRYLPLFPDGEENLLNEEFFLRAHNLLPELLPEFAHLAPVIRVVDIRRETGGRVLRVLLNAEEEEAVGLLADPGPALGGPVALRQKTGRIVAPEPPREEHGYWRLHMAERIAARMDPDRFGVKRLWVFGGTEVGVAGPGSDIDLLIHFEGTEEQRKELLAWLEGWSLALAEANYLRTGARLEGLLDVRLISERDIRERTGYAVKIGAATDPARPLALGGKEGMGPTP